MKKVSVYDKTNLKRDAIIDNVHKVALIPESVREEDSEESADPVGYAEARRRYENYMQAHGKRFTPEREFILRQIYELTAPVDISALYGLVCAEKGQVSLATVYNNLSLLVDAHLVRKLDLVGGQMSFYEKTLGVEPHGYAICQRCGRIKTIQLGRLKESLIGQLPSTFLVNDINLQVNCLCRKCQTALRKEAETEKKNAIRQRKAASRAGVLARQQNKRKKKKV